MKPININDSGLKLPFLWIDAKGSLLISFEKYYNPAEIQIYQLEAIKSCPFIPKLITDKWKNIPFRSLWKLYPVLFGTLDQKSVSILLMRNCSIGWLQDCSWVSCRLLRHCTMLVSSTQMSPRGMSVSVPKKAFGN